MAAGSCVALLSACAGGGPFSAQSSAPYAGDIEPSTVRPASPSDYPNLADVPARPDDLPTAAERAATRQALEQDLSTGQAISTAQTPVIAEDLADVAAAPPVGSQGGQPTVTPTIAEALSPEPRGGEEPGQRIDRPAEGPLIVDTQGMAEDTQPLERESLDDQPVAVAQAEAAEAPLEESAEEERPRRGFFARLFGPRPDDGDAADDAAPAAEIAVAENAASAESAPATESLPPDPNAELLLPQTEQPRVVVARVNERSNGELLLPQGEEPAPVEAEAVATGDGELMIPQQEEPAADAQPTAVATSRELMIDQREQPVPVEEPVVAVADQELLLPQTEEEAPEEVTVVAEATREEPIELETVELEAVESEPVALEPVELAVAEAEPVEKKPGFFARWFGGKGRQTDTAPDIAPVAVAEDPVERVVIAQISSNDPNLATDGPPDQDVAEATPVIQVEEVPVARVVADNVSIETDVQEIAKAPLDLPADVLPVGVPMSQERARALIAARESRDARALTATQVAATSTLPVARPPIPGRPERAEPAPLIAQERLPARQQSSSEQIAALPGDPDIPEEQPVTAVDEKAVAIATGPIDPTIRIFRERFAQSGDFVDAPVRVAAIPAGSLTTDLPPTLPRLGVIYFKPGEMAISETQRPITQAVATDLYAKGGSLRVVAHRNAAGLPGDRDPADAARRRLQEVIAGLMASGVQSQSIVSEIASPNNFHADMDYNRRVEIYLDSATPAR